jgi:hypothetical protein
MSHHTDENGDEDRENVNGARVFCLGAPLRLVNAFSAYPPAHRRGTAKHHFLQIEAGEHVILIESSPSGKSVRVTMDGNELT